MMKIARFPLQLLLVMLLIYGCQPESTTRSSSNSSSEKQLIQDYPDSNPTDPSSTTGTPTSGGASAPSIVFPNALHVARVGQFFELAPQSLNLHSSLISTCSILPLPPSGLTIHPQTCVISGTPTGIQQRKWHMVTVTNAEGETGSFSISLEVLPQASSLPGPILTYPTSYAQGFSQKIFNLVPSSLISNGSSIKDCVSQPLLPSGLQIHPTTCVITGFPQSAMARKSYTITVKNNLDAVSSTIIDLEIFNTTQLPVLAYTQTPFSFNISSAVIISPIQISAGGNDVQSCKVTPTLPGYLTINPLTCVVSGTPNQLSTLQTYKVTLTNQLGLVATSEFSLEILPSNPSQSSQEIIHDEAVFKVTNPVAGTCYYRINNNVGTKRIIKKVLPDNYGAKGYLETCNQVFGPVPNACNAKHITIEMFSDKNTVCNFGAEAPNFTDNLMLLSRKSPWPFNKLQIKDCAPFSSCYNHNMVNVEKGSSDNKKYFFKTGHSNGFNKKMYFEVHRASLPSGDKGNPSYTEYYINTILN